MVALGATKYLRASQKADRNSISNIDLAASARRFTTGSPSGAVLPELQYRRDQHDKSKRQGQEDLPAKPHQLVVAIARHHGFDHGEQEEQEAHLEREP